MAHGVIRAPSPATGSKVAVHMGDPTIPIGIERWQNATADNQQKTLSRAAFCRPVSFSILPMPEPHSPIAPAVADGLFCREIDGLFCRSSPDIIVRRRCVLSHKRRGWLQPSPSFRYSRNLALQDELYHPVINNGPAVLVCVDKRLGTGPVNQSRDAG